MNLVQINEHLKGVPMQALMSYANGQDPMVPAYMATGEMKRRELMAQKHNQAQQAAQSQLPTVKDQVEQQAGLMALQAQQQKQAQQQMMQQAQAQPMPIPPETPKPEMQGQEQPEFAMGGIAQLPVEYDFASGGIIAFAGEGRSDVPAVEETDEEKKRRIQALLSGQMPSTQSRPPPSAPTRQERQNDIDNRPAVNQAALAKQLDLQAMLSDPAAQQAAMSVLKPQDLETINKQRLAARELAGVKGEYGEEQRKRLGEEDAQYKEMLKNREFNNLLAVLSGMGRGGLGGAAPAYLQTQAAQQAADIAQKRRLNEQYGNIEAKQREEQMAAATGLTAEEARQRGLAGQVGGQMYSTQMQGLASLETEKQRAANEMKRQEANIAAQKEMEQARLSSSEKIAKMSRDQQFAIAQLDRDLRYKLHTTPSATLETSMIDDYVKNGLSRTEAYERVKQISSGYKGEMTMDQATDNVKQYLDSMAGMQHMAEEKKRAQESGVPFDPLAFRNKLIQQEMMRSGRGGGGAAGKVDTSNPLLK